LAVDVFETENNLVIKARTAGVDRNDLDVSISDGILTISGTLSSGDEADVRQWHIQECYWGEFSRTLALPTAVNEEGVKAELKDGVLSSVKTISQKIPSQVGGIFLATKKRTSSARLFFINREDYDPDAILPITILTIAYAKIATTKPTIAYKTVFLAAVTLLLSPAEVV